MNNKLHNNNHDLGNIFKNIVDKARFPSLVIGNTQIIYQLRSVDEKHIEEISEKYLQRVKENDYDNVEIINTIKQNVNIINKIIKDDMDNFDAFKNGGYSTLDTTSINSEISLDEYRELQKKC